MSRKFQILLLLIVCMGTKSFSQKCPTLYDVGDRLINESKNGTVCYYRETEKISEKTFKTKYTFKAEGGNEIYYLEFVFYIDSNKISVKYTNQLNNSFPLRFTNFSPKGSKYLFKDYRANETDIRKEELYTILFGVSNTDMPFIILYHFQLPDSEALIFKMKEIDEAKLNTHNTIALLYNSLEQNIPISTTLGINIKALKNEMLGYSDSVMKQIENDDQQFIEGIWPREASIELSRKFSAQLNNIFYSYFKNVFPYQAHDSRVEFKFICNPAGRVYTVKDVRSINSLQIKWIEDSFRVFVVPQLRQIDFETMTVQRDNKNLITDFNGRFSETINKLNRKDPWVDEVLDIQKKIRDELSTKMVRPKNIPTEYTYILNYQSVIKDELWEYREKTSKKPEVLGPVDSNEQISNDLKSKFRNRDIIRAKKSKYNIKRCDVTINNEKPVQDLKQTD